MYGDKKYKKCTLLVKNLSDLVIFLTIAIDKFLTTKNVENASFFILKYKKMYSAC